MDVRRLVKVAILALGALAPAGFLLARGQETKQMAVVASGYHVTKTIHLGGEGGWDYLTYDPASHRLFISRGVKVVVLDVNTEKVVGEIAETPGVHGIALAPELNRGFTSNGRGNNVTVFDLKTLATLDHVSVGQNPDAIVYDATTKRVFAMNGRSQDASAIDAQTHKVVGTIPLGGKPEFAVSDAQGHVYVNIEDKSELVQLDPEKLAVTAHWNLKPCEAPSGLAMDVEHNRLFAGCDNQMMAVVDAKNGKLVAHPGIGEGVDANAFDPGTQFALSSNGRSGTLTVVHEDSPDSYTVVENVPTQRGARTMALDPATHTVYLVTAEFGEPPAPTADNPHPRPTIKPDSFVVLVLTR